MRKTVLLSMPETCSQNWGQFSPTQSGGFCGTCNKNVVDFIKMSDQELLAFFKEKRSNTCGRFHASQLQRNLQPSSTPASRSHTLLTVGAFAFSLLLIAQPSTAQTAPVISTVMQLTTESQPEAVTNKDAGYKIKGIVRSAEDNMPLAGANVWLRGTILGTVTDKDGKFEFPQSLNEGDVLIFSFVGMQSKEYTITKQDNDSLEISMSISLELGPIMMGTVMVADVYTEEPKGLKKIWSSLKRKF